MVNFARQLMPPPLFNNMIRLSGSRMSWMKSHACPCSLSGEFAGSPNPSCNTCHGRGRWWEPPIGPFILLRTFMHTSEAADEPGATMNPVVGQVLHAEPTITIGCDILPVWSEAAEFDAFVENDTLTRFETNYVVGERAVLPYQQGLRMGDVWVYDQAAQRIEPVAATDYTLDHGEITLNGYPDGTAFTVSYKAQPVYIAWRRAGANPHTRMFGGGTASLPVRFRCQLLDLWTRSRNPSGSAASPQAVLP